VCGVGTRCLLIGDDGWNWKAGKVRAGRYLIALAGVSVLAAGCGTVHAGRSSSNTPDTLMSAVSHTGAQSARITITEAIQYTGMSMSYTQTGEFDFARSRGMITMAAPLDVTELFLPPKVYVKFSDTGSSLPHGKTWIAFNTGTMGSLGEDMLGPYGAGDNPADMLASLTAVAGSERILGTARVRGAATTEYQVNIDPAKMAAKAPASERASYRQFARIFGEGAIPVDVWVDSQHEVRQVRLSLHMPSGAQLPGNARLTETVGFYDFGVPVQVSAPPTSQVTSMPGDDVSVGSISSGSSIASASASVSAAPTPPGPVMSASVPAVSASAFQG
jgi:hypothetical protein